MVSQRGKTLGVTSNYRRVIVYASGQLISGLPFEFHVAKRTVRQTQPKDEIAALAARVFRNVP
jgi:uncharacterized integral membrane protein